MSESGDYTPSNWGRSHDFGSARSSYDNYTRRSYSSTKKSRKRKPRKEFLEKSLVTQAESPLVIVSDVTGSMRNWPATMFSKLPYFEHEAKEYLGDDLEICFSAIGDYSGKSYYSYSSWGWVNNSKGDLYPLQVRPFAKDADLVSRMKELILEGGGGGNSTEAYEMAATYFAHNCDMPNAINPVLIFIGDARSYDFVDRKAAREWTGVTFPGTGKVPTKEVMDQLQQKFSVYFIRKPYRVPKNNVAAKCDIKTQEQWESYLGADHIVFLPDPNRVVDCIFAVLAKETGRVDYFREELIDRQIKDDDGKEKIEKVLEAVKHIHEPVSLVSLLEDDNKTRMGLGNSVMVRPAGAKKTKKLL